MTNQISRIQSGSKYPLTKNENFTNILGGELDKDPCDVLRDQVETLKREIRRQKDTLNTKLVHFIGAVGAAQVANCIISIIDYAFINKPTADQKADILAKCVKIGITEQDAEKIRTETQKCLAEIDTSKSRELDLKKIIEDLWNKIGDNIGFYMKIGLSTFGTIIGGAAIRMHINSMHLLRAENQLLRLLDQGGCSKKTSRKKAQPQKADAEDQITENVQKRVQLTDRLPSQSTPVVTTGGRVPVNTGLTGCEDITETAPSKQSEGISAIPSSAYDQTVVLPLLAPGTSLPRTAALFELVSAGRYKMLRYATAAVLIAGLLSKTAYSQTAESGPVQTTFDFDGVNESGQSYIMFGPLKVPAVGTVVLERQKPDGTPIGETKPLTVFRMPGSNELFTLNMSVSEFAGTQYAAKSGVKFFDSKEKPGFVSSMWFAEVRDKKVFIDTKNVLSRDVVQYA